MMKPLFCLILLLHCFWAVPSLFDDGILYANTYYSVEPGNPQTPSDIKKWLALAEQGDAVAQYNLGVCYENGRGVAQNYAEAVKWYRKAAEQGDAGAQCNLGVCYANGQGVAQSYAEAVKWYRKAAEQGDARAQFNLGVCYANGQGVAQNDAEAVRWYRKAAEQGNARAQFNLGIRYFNGQGVRRSNREAAKWLKKASEQGIDDHGLITFVDVREATEKLSLSHNEVSFTYSGGSRKITISCRSTEWDFIDMTAGMCSIVKDADGITITCRDNDGRIPRKANILVYTSLGSEMIVTVTQDGKPASILEVKQTSLSVGASSGYVSVEVNTDDTDFEVMYVPDWCSVSKYKSSFQVSYEENPSYYSRSGGFYVRAAGKSVRVDITQSGKSRSGYGGGSRRSSYSYSYSDDRFFRIGLDAGMDYQSEIGMAFGAGARMRLGRYDQLLNLIGGGRYYCSMDGYTGVQIPVLLNLNLLRSSIYEMSMYIGGGYEFEALEGWCGQAVFQFGYSGKHADLYLYYKTETTPIGIGLTYYF